MMARPIIQATLAILLALIYLCSSADTGGVQADQLKEPRTIPQESLLEEIAQPELRIPREAGRKTINGRKNNEKNNKKMIRERNNKKIKTKSRQDNAKQRKQKKNARKIETNKRKITKKGRKKSKTKENKKKARKYKRKSRKDKKNRKLSKEKKEKSKKNQNKSKQMKRKIRKGSKKNKNKSKHMKMKMTRWEAKQVCDEKALQQKIKDYIKISNQLRKAKRITKSCDTMEKKAEKSLTTFKETVAALNKSLKCLESSSGRRTYLSRFNLRRFSRSIRNDTCLFELTGMRDLLEGCRKTAYNKCQTSTVEACQNVTHRTDCEEKLQDWLNKFGPKAGSCLKKSETEYCSCITAISPDVPADCLSFDNPASAVIAAKRKCTNSDEKGSFGFCKKLQLEAAIFISKCETCPSGANNCSQSTSTPGVITTTRKAVTSISGSINKKFLDFKHKAALHFDEIVLNLTSTDTARHDCPASSCQLALQECTSAQFATCVQNLFNALLTCRFQGIVACIQQALAAVQACFPCICKAIFIYWDKLPPGCKYCEGCPSICEDSWLVLTGGASSLEDSATTKLTATSEIITSTGVCQPNKLTKYLRDLPVKTTAGRSAWIDGEKVIYCGGSHTFKVPTDPTIKWGAVKQCYTTKSGDGTWNTAINMNVARSFFTLTPIHHEELVAVGGIDENGIPLTTKEVFSIATKTWKNNGTFANGNSRYGHCTVPFFPNDGESYLIIIGGSANRPSGGTLTPIATPIKLRMRDDMSVGLSPLPQNVGNGNGLWSPACSILSGNIFVSGGSAGNLNTFETGVHRYNIATNSWTTNIGTLQKPRYGHIMDSIPGSSGYQLIVGGGNQEDNKSVEKSQNHGVTWTPYSRDLFEGRVFIGLIKVPVDTFECY